MTTSTKSTILDSPFDIYEVDLIVDGNELMHLAPEVPYDPNGISGINQIAPLESGTDIIYYNAWGEPIGRPSPRPLSKHVAVVTISLYANSPDAETMMDLVISGDPVAAEITASRDAGTTLKTFKVDNVVFLLPTSYFNIGQRPLVFRGTGWNVSVEVQRHSSRARFV